jgi:hypothetical protein
MSRVAFVVLAAAACHRAPEAVPPSGSAPPARGAAPASPPPPASATPTFNDRVLTLIASYPAGGHGGYAWPSVDGDGATRDLALGDDVIVRGGVGNHCVGVTFEVFWRALEACDGGAAAVLDAAAARDLRRRWYVPALGGAGAAEALPAHGLGDRIGLDDARPGDFVQAWAPVGTGHSMVFLGWDRDPAGRIAAIRYWSSQPWTDGIGVSAMTIGDGGFDPDQIHVARAACPAPGS